jgi:catechol 2,3-dioxygenase-like lactoylglutathione lyase family enzyme
VTDGILRLRHVKIPVTDLAKSTAWYRSLLDLEMHYEFVEGGVLRGVSLINRSNGVIIALRDREVSAGRPSLEGFDVVAFAVSSRAALEALAERAGAGEVRDNGPFGSSLDLTDPDGTVLRFLWESPEAPQTFVGFEFGADGAISTYDRPRLGEPG